ncbi:MAG: anti-sigma factor, partial [Candidatus Limnocylindria bacterium]
SLEPAPSHAPAGRAPRRWGLPALAGLAVAAALALAAWNVQLTSDLRGREADLERVAAAIAAGEAAHRASGSAGSGYLIDAVSPVLVATLPPAPDGHLYEMWLLDAAGAPVAVGTFSATDRVVVVELERGLSGFTTFAVTVERARVSAPTGDPVLLAPLSG